MMVNKVKLGDIIEIKHGFAFESKYFSDEGPIVLTPGNFHLSGGLKLTQDNCKRYSAEYLPKHILNNGDLVIVMTDLTKDCNLLGRPALIDSPETILHNQRIGKIEFDSKKVTKEFLYHTFLSEPYLNEIKKTATGTTVRHTSNSSIYNIDVFLPPINKQIQIAEVLNACDTAIKTLEELILKKELSLNFFTETALTNKRMERITLSLSDLGEVYSGLNGKTAEDFGAGFPFITYMNVFSNSKIDLNNVGLVSISDNENQNKVRFGDIFFTVSSETPDEVGMTSVLLDEIDEMYLNSFCFGYRLNNFKQLLPEYARFYLRSLSFRMQMRKLAQGSTRFNLSKTEVLKLELTIPTDVNDQRKIAKLLSELEHEIALLKIKQGLFVKQKQGISRALIED